MQLTPECRDLLDRIFVIDEKKRISIQDIKAHAWYNKALMPRHQHAELDLLEQQKRLEAHLATRTLDQVAPCLTCLTHLWSQPVTCCKVAI